MPGRMAPVAKEEVDCDYSSSSSFATGAILSGNLVNNRAGCHVKWRKRWTGLKSTGWCVSAAAEGWHLWREEAESVNPSQAGFYLVAIWLQPGRMPPVEKEEFELSPIQIPSLQQIHFDWLWASWGLYLDACGRGRPNCTVLWLLTPVKGRSWLGYESQSTCSLHRCYPATDIMDHLWREEVDWVIPDAGDGASGGKARKKFPLPFLQMLHLHGLCGWTLRSMECC